MDICTIQEKVNLPSKGILYKDVPEFVTMRSMTTEEEMRRLSLKESYYKKMCDIIDTCIIDTMNISSYDMCLGDYQGLIYGLRTVTYGSKVSNISICPKCGHINTQEVDLYSFPVIEFNGFKDEDFEVELPKSKIKVTVKYQTPRILDSIDNDVKEYVKKHKDENGFDPTLLYTLKYGIQYVGGELYDPIKKEAFIKKLPMMDTSKIFQRIMKLNNKVGLNTDVDNTICENKECGLQYKSSFRVTPEFFGPDLD